LLQLPILDTPVMTLADDLAARIAAIVSPLSPLELPLADALGCVLHEEIRAPGPVPAFDTVTTEGFAVRAGSYEPGEWLRVVDEVPAGFRASEELADGTCIRVWPGAPLPPGADSVVPLGLAEVGTEATRLQSASIGDGIHAVGSVTQAGAIVAKSGQVASPLLLAELARSGIRSVCVHPRPRVLALTVGSEFVEPGVPTGIGLVTDHLSLLATSIAESAGAVASRIPAVPMEVSAAIDDQCHRADAILLVGVAPHDSHVVSSDLGLEILSPEPVVALGFIGPTLVLALGSDLRELHGIGGHLIPGVVRRLMGFDQG
jgi:molybdopterin molybdotransferase